MPRLRAVAVLALPLLAAAPPGTPAATLFLLERAPHGVALRADSVAVGEVAVFPVAPDSGLIDVVLPVGPGQSAALIRPADRGMIVVRNDGAALRVSFRRPDGTLQPRPARPLAEIAREEVRLCVTGGDGTRAAFVIAGNAVASRDSAGPVANMFAGKLPFALGDGDWIVQTETWRRSERPAPRGRMACELGRYLVTDAVRPDGTRGRFVVDLGASGTMVAPGFVPVGQTVRASQMVEHSAAGEKRLPATASDATGGAPAVNGETVFPSLELGGVRVDSLDALVSPIPRGLGDDVVGILGIDVLRRADRIRLVLPAKGTGPASLEFDPQAPLARVAGASGFAWSAMHVVLPGEVAGRPAHWILDSGAPASFVDSLAVAGEAWAATAPAAAPVHGSAGVARASATARAPSVRLGSGAAWTDVPVRLATLAPFEPLRGDGRVPALLGLPEIARLGALELDFARHEARWGDAR